MVMESLDLQTVTFFTFRWGYLCRIDKTYKLSSDSLMKDFVIKQTSRKTPFQVSIIQQLSRCTVLFLLCQYNQNTKKHDIISLVGWEKFGVLCPKWLDWPLIHSLRIGYWPRRGLYFSYRQKSRSISYLLYIYWPYLGFLTFPLSYRLALT